MVFCGCRDEDTEMPERRRESDNLIPRLLHPQLHHLLSSKQGVWSRRTASGVEPEDCKRGTEQARGAELEDCKRGTELARGVESEDCKGCGARGLQARDRSSKGVEPEDCKRGTE